MTEMNEADAVEQHLDLVPDDDETGLPGEVPFDANEADAVEQEQVVRTDEEDYR